MNRSLALLALLVAACTPAPAPAPAHSLAVVELRESVQTLNLRVGQPLVLRLPANPSTGYDWQLVTPSKLMRVEGQPRFEDQRPVPAEGETPMVGVPGLSVWTLHAERGGSETLRFEYRRPWETDSEPARILSYRITVE
jgi:inhibitor of cysteine peptidase